MKRYEIAFKQKGTDPNSMNYLECGRSFDTALKKAKKLAQEFSFVSLDEYHGPDKDDCSDLMKSWYVFQDGSFKQAN